MLTWKCLYVHIYICIYMRISFSDFHESKDCVYCFEKCGSAKAVSWNCNKSHPSKVVSLLWPQQTEDGCHQSMWNALFKPFCSDCDMTRFQAHQTLIYIMWALCFTPIYHLIFFQNFEKCIDNISSHCAINDWMNYVKIFRRLNQLYSDCLKNKRSMQYDSIQCNIAELCVYIVLKL